MASYSICPMRWPPENAASSTSTTSGFGPFMRLSASAITAENSGSTSRIFAPPCSSMNAIAPASSRVFSAFKTPPAIGTAK